MQRGLFHFFFYCLSVAAIPSRAFDGASSDLSASSLCERVSKGTVLIVDAYSSGSLLAPELIAQGYNIVHVHGKGTPLDFQTASFHAKNFSADFAHQGNWAALVEWVRQQAPRAILAGSESGVLLADQLAAEFHEELGVPSNGIDVARRDKYFMAEKLRSAGIPAVMQMKTREVTHALSWIRAKKLFPGKVVVKPIMSAGGMGVHICNSEAEVLAAFDTLLDKENGYRIMNSEILVQEFLDGEEYVVNTVSAGGIHTVSEIWLYHKKANDEGRWIYDHDRLLPFKGDLAYDLSAYVFRVLDALGIATGWGHAEVKMTRRGPVLVEIGARMMGSLQPRLAKDALGINEVDLGIEAFLYPENFYRHGMGYDMKKGAALVTLNNPYPWARLNGSEMNEAIRALPGYQRHSFAKPDGTLVPKSNDLHAAIGQVELVHEDPKVLDASIATLHQWEAEGRFLTPAPAPESAQ